MNDTDARLWHPWLRINRVLRVMLHTRWCAQAWSEVGVEFKRPLSLRSEIRRAGGEAWRFDGGAEGDRRLNDVLVRRDGVQLDSPPTSSTEVSMRLIGLAVILTLSLFAAPLAAEAQAPKVPRVGVLILASLSARPQQWEGFRQGLREHGYVEGQNIVIEYRSAEGKLERLAELAAELVQAKADVIVASGTEATQAAKKATATIPIIMSNTGDPVGAGIVANLARPGGNITGLSLLATELSAKRLELLKETLPKLVRVAILWNPNNASVALKFKETETAARMLSLQLQSLQVQRPADLESAIQAAVNARADALVTADDQLLSAQRVQIVSLAMRYRLPMGSEFREFATAGGLMSYGPSLPDLARRAAGYVDKILKGAKPGDLPVEQPTKFELVINLKTAKALGLTIPQTLLLQADQVIE